MIVLPLLNRVGRLYLTARQINVSLSDAVTQAGHQGRGPGRRDGQDRQRRGVDPQRRRAVPGPRGPDRLDRQERPRGLAPVDRRHADGRGAEPTTAQKFQQEVQDAAKGDLATSGLTIDNFTIQAIRDEVGYMDLIGQQETARRERDARMAKALADQEAAVREAEAQQVKLNAQRDVRSGRPRSRR